MPTKSTKTTKKSDSKTSEITEKKDLSKKIIVKRRKVDLVPTKASAVAIVSQVNRAKKQALIDKVASTDIPYKKTETSSDTKIPLRVWIFFGTSLILFCISFYQAIFRPQLEDNIVENIQSGETINLDGAENIENNIEVDNNEDVAENVIEKLDSKTTQTPTTPKETIELFFNYLSNRQFDEAFDLMIPAMKNNAEIRDHFTSFRMNPFLDGIEGGIITPINFEYINSPTYGKDVYKFDLSYSMKTDQSKYDETWEFTVNTKGDEPKISSIRCVTSKCSYHPIFWPENFGLMK